MAVPDVFDTAGNWDWFQLGSDPNTPYVPNALNLYDSINDPNDPETPTESFTYDEDHNLTEACGTGVSPVKHTYDAETVTPPPTESGPPYHCRPKRRNILTALIVHEHREPA